MLGVPVAADELATALPALGTVGAQALGLVASGEEGEIVTPLVDLRPYSFVENGTTVDWWIASDLGELVTGRALRACC